MTDSVNAGADDVKRANCGSKLEQWRAMQESGCHVATSPRRDVPTSRRPHVATSQRRDVPTSRRPNVATLGQLIQKSTIKNVTTSQRLNVAASQRRDVATLRRQHEICTSSFKAPMVQKSGDREAYERGHGIPE